MKEIFCQGCRIYLGIIRDAKLKKGMVFLCSKCETKRIASDLANKNKQNNPFPDFMDIFVGKAK